MNRLSLFLLCALAYLASGCDPAVSTTGTTTSIANPASYVPQEIKCSESCPATHTKQNLKLCEDGTHEKDNTLECPEANKKEHCYCTRTRAQAPAVLVL